MLALNATNVRKEWGFFIDSVVREKPKIIKRSRDYIFASSLDMLKEMLAVYKFNAKLYAEKDGTITTSLDEIDLVVNGKTKEEAIDILAADLMEYAEDFYNNFEYWFSAPNRKAHLPYVLHVLIQDDKEGVKNIIKCQNGKI